MVEPNWDAEDGDGGAQAASAPVSAAPAKPEVSVHDSKRAPGLVLPKPPVQPEAKVAPVPAAADKADATNDNFPNDYGKCLVLLKEFQGADKLGDRPTKEQVARKAKYFRLKRHVFDLQQGMTTVHTTAHSKGAFIGLHTAGLERTKLDLLARTNPAVKKLLAERDALAKENAELKELLDKA
jgi:hypothetical protein